MFWRLGFWLLAVRAIGGMAAAQTTTAPATQPVSPDRAAAVTQAQLHLALGLADWGRGRFDLALNEANTVLKFDKLAYGDGPNATVARTLLGIGNCLVQLNRPKEALSNFQASLKMYRDVYGNGDRRELAFAMGRMGWCDHLVGQDDQGGQLLKDTGAMLERLAQKQDAADLSIGLGLVGVSLEGMDRAQDAVPFHEAAMSIAKRLCQGRDDVNWAVQMDGMANCLSCLGHFAQALSYNEAATEMGRRLLNGADSLALATGIEHSGDCLANLGRYTEALPLLQESLDMRRRIAGGKDDANVVQGLNMVAVCLGNMGRTDEALKTHQAGLEMAQRLSAGQDNFGLAFCMEYVAVDEMSVGRASDALPLLHAALDMRRHLLGNRDEPVIAANMGYIAVNLVVLGRDKEALAMLEPATKMAERLRSPFLFMYNRVLGGLRLKLGDPAGAAVAFEAGIDSIEEFRNSLGGDDQDRMGAMNAYGGWDPFSGMVRAQLELGHADAAAEFLDRGRAKSLLDYLERGERLSNGDLLDPVEKKAQLTNDTEKLKEISEVRVALAAADNQVQQLTSQIGHARALNNDAGLAEIRELQPKLNLAFGQYGDALRRKFNLAGQTTFTTAATSVQIQSLLGPREHLLMYSMTPKDGVVLLVPPQGQAISGMYLTGADGKTRLSGTAIQKLIRDYRQAVVRHGMDSIRGVRLVEAPDVTTRPEEDIAQEGYQLFCNLMPPKIWQQIQGDDLVYVIPDASMSGLPLEMLIAKKPQSTAAKDNSYWLDDGPSLCYGPSAAALLELRRQEPDRTGRTYAHEAVLLGDPILQRDESGLLRKPVPRTGAYVASVQAGSGAEAIGLRKGAVILGYGPVAVVGKDQFDDVVDKLELLKFRGKLNETPKVKFWLDGQIVQRELPLDSPPGVELADMTLELAATLAPSEPQPVTAVAMRDKSLTRYGALSPLPGTRLEVTGIYKVLTGTASVSSSNDSVVVLLGEDATSERLANAARGTRFLHLATHGLVESGQDAIYSSLVLSQPEVITPQDTGMLTLQDLFDHWWGRLDGTELVVLSACDSEGLDERGSNALGGEGVFGLPWGFMYAGSPAVVASLWEVQDASTAELMQKFYGDMEGSTQTTKLEAFTRARKELKKNYAEPFFWAPFIFLGDPN
jgi:tetratricopeptide (TPR) repeat protein